MNALILLAILAQQELPAADPVAKTAWTFKSRALEAEDLVVSLQDANGRTVTGIDGAGNVHHYVKTLPEIRYFPMRFEPAKDGTGFIWRAVDQTPLYVDSDITYRMIHECPDGYAHLPKQEVPSVLSTSTIIFGGIGILGTCLLMLASLVRRFSGSGRPLRQSTIKDQFHDGPDW